MTTAATALFTDGAHQTPVILNRACVLVVDDDRLMRRVAHEVLAKEQFKVIEAESGEEALELLSLHGVDLVLLDACMPGLDGFAVCRQIRAQPEREHLPIIMVTGLDEEDAVATAFDSGASDYVSKPINWTILKKRIGSIVGAECPGRAALSGGRGGFEVPEGLADAVLVLDAEGVISMRERITALPYAFAQAMQPGACLLEVLPEDSRPAALRAWQQCQAGRRPSSFPINVTHAHQPFVAEVHLMPQGDRVVGLIKNHTESFQLEQSLYQATYHDPQTGLATSVLFKQQLAEALQQEDSQHATQLCRVVVEDHARLLERFDYQGMKTLYAELVSRLRTSAEPLRTSYQQIHLGRLSDQEVACLFSGYGDAVQVQGALKEAARLLCCPFEVDGQRVTVRCTLGVAASPAGGRDVEALMDSARLACTARDKQCENGMVVYSPTMRSEMAQRTQMEKLLRRDLENGGMHMNYQPKFAAKSLQLIGIEALIRWHSEELGIVPPVKFIPLAEQNGLMDPLSEFVIDAVLDQSARWQADGLVSVPVAINLPGSQLSRHGIVDSLCTAIKRRGLAPHWLEIEVTEEVMVDRSSRAIEHLRQLRDLGVRIAIDDFGTGYSSFSYLRELPVDILKIDRSFVANIDRDTTAFSLAQAIVTVGHELGLEVVAEGVESEAQLRVLQQMGCDVIQGYYTGRPMESDQLAGVMCGVTDQFARAN